jgi:putative PIN family toxin of toxin-antitoxin system
VKIVVDTNTLISGFLWEGTPAKLMTAALSGRARLFSTTELLLEFQEILHRPKFGRRFLARGETPADIFERYRSASVKIIPVKITPPKNLRDSDDAHILACAVAAQADAIVSGDDDLLMLGSFEKISIINAAEALERLKTAP